MLKKITLTLFCFVSLLQADFREVTPKDLQEMINYKIPVIDIRTAQEWEQTGVIPTSEKIMFFDKNGKYDLKAWLPKLFKIVKNKKQPFALICRSGNRTGSLGEYLAFELKFENVYHLQEGINSWIEEGRKIEK